MSVKFREKWVARINKGNVDFYLLVSILLVIQIDPCTLTPLLTLVCSAPVALSLPLSPFLPASLSPSILLTKAVQAPGKHPSETWSLRPQHNSTPCWKVMLVWGLCHRIFWRWTLFWDTRRVWVADALGKGKEKLIKLSNFPLKTD